MTKYVNSFSAEYALFADLIFQRGFDADLSLPGCYAVSSSKSLLKFRSGAMPPSLRSNNYYSWNDFPGD